MLGRIGQRVWIKLITMPLGLKLFGIAMVLMASYCLWRVKTDPPDNVRQCCVKTPTR